MVVRSEGVRNHLVIYISGTSCDTALKIGQSNDIIQVSSIIHVKIKK